MLDTEKSYLCCSLEDFNLCREVRGTHCLLLWVLTGWCLTAQLSVICSAPCEHSPGLWNGWWLCSDVAADLLNLAKTGEHRRHNACRRVSPVWATVCVQPLHTWTTFSPPRSEQFTRVGEDRKGSVVVSWPCLLLPHRNKSPSPAHMTEATLLSIQQPQQQKEQSSNWTVLVN